VVSKNSGLTHEQLIAYFKLRLEPSDPWTVRAWRKFLRYAMFWKDSENDEFWSDQGQWTDGAKHYKGWLGDQIVEYIEEYGLEEGDFIVISKQMLENIRKGGMSHGK
jgi:hypothetical protein